MSNKYNEENVAAIFKIKKSVDTLVKILVGTVNNYEPEDIDGNDLLLVKQRALNFLALDFSTAVFSKLENKSRVFSKLDEAYQLIDMVEDNSKMPHPHGDPQTRLYCLAERAREFKEKYKG